MPVQQRNLNVLDLARVVRQPRSNGTVGVGHIGGEPNIEHCFCFEAHQDCLILGGSSKGLEYVFLVRVVGRR